MKAASVCSKVTIAVTSRLRGGVPVLVRSPEKAIA